MAGYAQRLHAAIRRTGTPSLVGIDPRWDLLPQEIRDRAIAGGGSSAEQHARGFEHFSLELLDIISESVAVVKPQVAFFEQLGIPGLQTLHRVMTRARELGLLVIADAKRGDIGSTAEAYAAGWLAGEDPGAAEWPADALTVNPYLGADTLQPFVEIAQQRGAGIYVLVRTSNPGAAVFQDPRSNGDAIYEIVADRVCELTAQTAPQAGDYGCVGAVVGATWPEQLQQLRARMPGVPFLVPGYGAQGGTSADTAGAFDTEGLGAVINSSRGINFAWRSADLQDEFGEGLWREAIAEATRRMRIDLAEHTPAGQLISAGA